MCSGQSFCCEAVDCVLDRVCVVRQCDVFWTQYRVVREWAVLLSATGFLAMRFSHAA